MALAACLSLNEFIMEECKKFKTSPLPQLHNVNGNNYYIIGNGNYINCTIGAETKAECENVEDKSPGYSNRIGALKSTELPIVPDAIVTKPDIDLEDWMENHPREIQKIDLREFFGADAFVLKIEGRQMEPEYKEGTYLVLRKLKDISYACADGTPYVVNLKRPHTLFRCLSKECDGSYILKPVNDEYGPIYIKDKYIYNVYEVVGSFRKE